MATTVLQNQRGFTLIEMSIVLVIIGLIIGGILKGQELIESSRQKNFISQIDTIRAAATTFQDRYRAFPGDYGNAVSSIAGCNATVCINGNDDGLLNADPGGTTAQLYGKSGVGAATAGTETWEFFQHLVAGNLIGNATLAEGATARTNFAGGNQASPLPSAAFPQSGLTIVYGTHAGPTTPASPIRGHWLRASRFTASTFDATTAIISPNRLAQLDQKYDDGLPLTGGIRSSDGNGACNTAGTNTYLSTDTSVQCHIFMPLE